MAEPPYKRARRPDSKQMWEESDRRSGPRDREEPRDRRDDRYGDRDRDRNRRYRSRSPRGSRGDRDRGRGGRRDDGRDQRGGYRRDERDRGDDRLGRRDVDDRYGGRGGRNRDEAREPRNRPRDRSRSPRRSSSRSPRRETDYDSRKERDVDKGKDPFLGGREEFSKSRTATPPAHVSFKVHGASNGSARDSPAVQDHDRMVTDNNGRNGRANSAVRDTVEEQNVEEDDEIEVQDDGMEDMKAMMGFGGFGTTHMKKVPGNNVSAIRKEKKTEYRQLIAVNLFAKAATVFSSNNSSLSELALKYPELPQLLFLELRKSLAAVLSCFTGTVHAAEEPSILINEIGRASNQSLLWGPYRPNLYFGVRPRIPKSFMGALMWAKVDNYQDVQDNFRHTCEQHDGMKGYGWDEYDPRKGGEQTIHDPTNFIDISTFFVKVPGGSHGGSWAVRIRGKAREDAPEDLKTTVVFHASLEGLGSLGVDEPEPLGYPDDVTFNGESEGLGKYTLTVTKGRGFHPAPSHASYDDKPLDRTMVNSFTVPEEYVWQSKALMFQLMSQQIDEYKEAYGDSGAPPPWQVFTIKNSPGAGNVHMIQKVFEGDFEFDVIFSSGSAERELTSQDVSKYITSNHKSYWERFISAFDPQPPFDVENLQRFTSNMFSNLLGGLGYFYGDAIVDRSYAPEYDEENEGFWEEAAEARARNPPKPEGPYELFTTVPSRPFFPRGFLWDEGFHLLPIADWDMDLTLEVVKSWFNLMDEDGWIAREQILGNEARTKVPPEFQTQYPHYANPPTLFFILENFISKLGAMNGTKPPVNEKLSQGESIYSAHIDNPEVANQYLQNIYPLLKRQFQYFHKTQAGDIKTYDREAYNSKEAFRWRGRTPMHILTSGLDDYPRPQPPHPGELHVDLMSWMGMMTRSLKNIASFLDFKEDVAELTAIETAILRNLDDLHWSQKDKCFCDATIDDYEEHTLDEKLGHLLDLIGDEEELWSDFGIRSLSKKDVFYGTGENYWRGPIWININYLAVTQLLNYAKTTGPYQEKARDLYTRLRMNLVKTIYDEWTETGFAWEQYNPETGKGQRTQHFTGWTSLVVKIMNLEDLSGGKYQAEQPATPKRDEL
ncbi:hypothetical protein B7463_g1592, partial [Scytalidium lignicola]